MEQLLINGMVGLLSLIAVVGGWFARQLWDAVKKLQLDLKSIELKLAQDYIPYNRLQDAIQPILEKIQEHITSENRYQALILQELKEVRDNLKTKVDR